MDAEIHVTDDFYHQSRNGDDKKTEESTEENVYHILEGPCDQDYEDIDEEECENVYHVLEGPTPKR